MSEWQPIETAPLGATLILVSTTDLGMEFIDTAYWAHDNCWRLGSPGNNERLWLEPTHWQPCPPPPVRSEPLDR
jgi:hypothetical protein